MLVRKSENKGREEGKKATTMMMAISCAKAEHAIDSRCPLILGEKTFENSEVRPS